MLEVVSFFSKKVTSETFEWFLTATLITANILIQLYLCKSSHQRCSIIKGVLRNFAKFTGKHLCQSLFFNKFAGLPATLLKKTLVQVFSCKFAKFQRTPFLSTEHLPWLLLFIYFLKLLLTNFSIFLIAVASVEESVICNRHFWKGKR